MAVLGRLPRVPFLTPSETPTVLLTCELLDNLPHDKVRVKGGRIFEQGEITESPGTAKDGDLGGDRNDDDKHHMDSPKFQETFVPLSDPLLSTVLKLAPAYTRSSMIAWIPTVACGVLHRLHQERPNSTLMFADFDWLPPPDLQDETSKESISFWGPGEPIITDMKGRIYCRFP